MSRGRTLEHMRRGIEHEAAVGSGIYRILSPADTRSTVNSAFVSIRTVCRFVAPASCSNERSSTGATYSLPKLSASRMAVPAVFQTRICSPHGAVGRA